MKQNLRRAVNITALVLAAGLLIGLLTGCSQSQIGNSKPQPGNSEPQTVTITVKGDQNVIVNEPKTIEVAKGTKWSEVKLKVNVSYKDGYKAKGWKFDDESGSDLYDALSFNNNATVFAISKKIPQPNDPDLFKTDGNGTITGYTCDKEDLPKALVIPGKIGDEVITEIGERAFYDCKGLTSLDLSGCTSLTTIGNLAFFGCMGLTEVKLPANLTTIGESAF
ncbi:leucine-rich repeat domain-containing protein, partial [Treponema denticola]